MKVLGGIAILIAAFLAWGAFNNYSSASSLKSEISKQSGLTKFFGQGMGLNEIDKARIQQFEDNGMKCGVGAFIIGIVGFVMCGAKSS